jgi:hypothetical protein
VVKGCTHRSLKVPGRHDLHPVPSPLLYLPVEQDEQLLTEVLPVEDDPVPAGQLVQLPAPGLGLKVFAGQDVQVPPAVEYLPAGQSVQSEDESEPEGEVVPAGQDMQVVPPGEYLPASQLVQSVDESEPARELFPGAQLVQALPEGAYVPAGHRPQPSEVIAPGFIPFPAAQFLQPDPKVEYFPAGHWPQVA